MTNNSPPLPRYVSVQDTVRYVLKQDGVKLPCPDVRLPMASLPTAYCVRRRIETLINRELGISDGRSAVRVTSTHIQVAW